MSSPDTLVPWDVSNSHRWDYALAMLRAEQHRRAGTANSLATEARLDQWLAKLRRQEKVVTYDRVTGFAYVQRRPSDTDLVRNPG